MEAGFSLPSSDPPLGTLVVYFLGKSKTDRWGLRLFLNTRSLDGSRARVEAHQAMGVILKVEGPTHSVTRPAHSGSSL